MDTHSERLVKQGKCSIIRFWGQTRIFLPMNIADVVGEEEIKKLAKDVFKDSKREINEEWDFYRDPDGGYKLEMPSVRSNMLGSPYDDSSKRQKLFKEDPTNIFPDWNKPVNLVRRIRRRYNRLNGTNN